MVRNVPARPSRALNLSNQESSKFEKKDVYVYKFDIYYLFRIFNLPTFQRISEPRENEKYSDEEDFEHYFK